MNFREEVMNKIAIINQYKTLYGDKDIHEYYNCHKTYVGIEEYLKKKMKEKNCENEETTGKL